MFKPFYFEGNLMWGHFNTPDDVKNLLEVYTYKELRKAKVLSISLNSEKICFGFYAEYNGNLTFGEWIDKNNQEMYFKNDSTN